MELKIQKVHLQLLQLSGLIGGVIQFIFSLKGEFSFMGITVH